MTNQPSLPNVGPEPTATAAATDRAACCDRLRQYLRAPAFRATEGFPLGDDDAILTLSDPPYYTACPNPFLPEILVRWQARRICSQHRLCRGNTASPVNGAKPD